MGHQKFSWVLSVLGFFMLSCSKDESSAIKLKDKGIQQQVASGHGPTPDTTNPNANQEQDATAVPPAEKPPVETPKVKANPDAAKAANVAMLASGRVVTQVSITNAVGWGTSAATPIEIKVPVTAAGALILPPTLPATQQVAGVKDNLAADTPFEGVTTLHAALKVCNETGRGIQLHSGGGGPFKHGNAIATGTCQIMLVNNLANNPGSSYDHMQGSNAGNVLFKFRKILPDGSEMP
jgi:hypothetical protein